MHQQSVMVGDLMTDTPGIAEEGINNGICETNSSFAYDDLFPALPNSKPSTQRPKPQVANSSLRVGSSLHTQVFHVPYEERKLDNSNTFGEGESLRTCQAITKETNAHIEISTSKDGSLTFLLTGKHAAVLEARRKILTHFQQQANKQLAIPKEHHRWILGKQGQKLRELEQMTATKISVPPMADNSEVITITGTKEGIEKAEHEIRICSEEQSKKAMERVSVPKIYHPFICGPSNETVNALAAETGARIHIPPAATQKDEIVIAGEKNGVLAAKAKIEAIYHEMEKKCQTVHVEVPKSQHKYVIGVRGSTIAEILRETGVSVEMPPSESPTSTIALRGPHDKLGIALSKVWDKANSVKVATIEAPSWIQKYIIGKKGVNIQKITQDFPKVHVDMIHAEEKIRVDGPREQVELAATQLEATVAQLLQDLTHTTIPTNPKHYKHIIGKNGANINRIKDETGVNIEIIEKENNSVIRIEGSHEGVAKAEKELRETVEKLDNERTKEFIVESKYIKSIIGNRGEKIREIRDKFDSVLITLPDQGQKRAPIKLRGPREDIEKCEKYFHKLIKEIAEVSYEQAVPVFKRFHKHVIGKGGSNLKKIREETHTQVELPAEGSDDDAIVVRGRREDVERAVQMIVDLQSGLESVVTEHVQVPRHLYTALIGPHGRLIHALTDEYGVRVHFPAPNDTDSKVTVKGPAEDVCRAVAAIQAAAADAALQSHEAVVKAPMHLHKFLIGKNGANVKKIRDETGARILFPTDKDEDKENIVILATTAEGAEMARAKLEAAANALAEQAEGELNVAVKHHRHFVARRGDVLKKVSDVCGGVQISFPRQGETSERVVIKGPKDCLEQAKKMILDIVDDLESKITIDCVIPQKYHRTVMGARGSKVKEISADNEVQIKFPERDSAEPDSDVIRITGRPERCEAAQQALLQQVPITVDVTVPNDLHRLLNGQRKREMMQQFDVHILLPPQEELSDIVQVTGTPSNVEKAKQALIERIGDLEKEKEDRVLRSYEVQFKVDPEYLPLVIGKNGSVISKIRQDHGVQISLPKRGEADEDTVTIQGYEDKVIQAKEAILNIVNQLDNQFKEEVEISQEPRLRKRLIGRNGKNIKDIMTKFKVDIRLPDKQNNLVIIAGEEDNVLDAKDYLLLLCEEMMQDIEERYQHMRPPLHSLSDFTPTGSHGSVEENGGNGFVVRDAPWQRSAPDTASAAEFPSITSAPVTGAVAWGPRR